MELNNDKYKIPYFLLDYELITNQNSSLNLIYKELVELCCDEYYSYWDYISCDFLKKYFGSEYKEKILLLIQRSICNNSIKCFELLVSKFNIKFESNLTLKKTHS